MFGAMEASPTPAPAELPTRRMTWAEIRRAFPDAWVFLHDIEFAGTSPRIVAARVLTHGPTRKDVHARTPSVAPPFAIRYTGTPSVDDLAFVYRTPSP